MRKGIVAIVISGAALLGPAAAAFAGPSTEPPRGPCNRGTMHAHQTVPHTTGGNHQAHSSIPHC